MDDDLWNEARADVSKLDAKFDQLTLDQQLKLAQVKALLAIGQELSQIQDQGINPDWSRD